VSTTGATDSNLVLKAQVNSSRISHFIIQYDGWRAWPLSGRLHLGGAPGAQRCPPPGQRVPVSVGCERRDAGLWLDPDAQPCPALACNDVDLSCAPCVGFEFLVRFRFALRSLALCSVCASAPSFVSGWRAFSSVTIRKIVERCLAPPVHAGALQSFAPSRHWTSVPRDVATPTLTLSPLDDHLSMQISLDASMRRVPVLFQHLPVKLKLLIAAGQYSHIVCSFVLAE
jgi:hypothetical protein